jgi:FkbH-like protein
MKDEILAALSAVSDTNDKLLVIHSSLPLLGVDPTKVKWDFLSAIKQLAASGKTIALPTYTPSFCGGATFDIWNSPSEVGILGQWVLELAGAYRTPHPIYSWAVLGPLADDLVNCSNSTTWGDDSTFAYFEKADARVIMLGADWVYCTQFHRYEEVAPVTYRYFKTFRGTANFGLGMSDCEAKMFVRDLEADCRNDFYPIVQSLAQDGKLREIALGSGLVRSAKVLHIREAALKLLGKDPFALVQNGRQIEHRINMRLQANSLPPLKLVVLGQSNLELLGKEILGECIEHIPDRNIEIYAPPFDQTRKELMLADSALKEFKPDFTLFIDRAEDLLGGGSLEELVERVGRDRLIEQFEQYMALAEEFARTNGGQCFVASFARLSNPALGNADLLGNNGVAGLIDEMNQRLFQRCNNGGPLHVLDISRVLVSFSGFAVDPRLWYFGRFPFSQEFNERLATAFTGLVLAATGRTSRLIVLDLDNTLWGGVVGEDGINGIQLGGDYPGNAYSGFQKCLRSLASRGIALAIASKNDEDLGLQVIRQHPEMDLTMDGIVGHRINWLPKWQNVVEIAEELNLSLRNVMFIDDNPVEREHIRQQLPMVRVLELPDDPALFTSTLLNDPYIETLGITEEDKKRVRSYQARRLAEEEMTTFERVEDFYASLHPNVSLIPVDEHTMARAVQLISKTTQFNTTTPQYSQTDLEAMLADEGISICIIGYEDRYSERENIGLVIVRWNTPRPDSANIDTFLMSCRVLGRGVEPGVLSWVADESRRRRILEITGQIIQSPRNTPARSLYLDNGFTYLSDTGWWQLGLGEKSLPKPAWLTLSDPILLENRAT